EHHHADQHQATSPRNRSLPGWCGPSHRPSRSGTTRRRPSAGNDVQSNKPIRTDSSLSFRRAASEGTTRGSCTAPLGAHPTPCHFPWVTADLAGKPCQKPRILPVALSSRGSDRHTVARRSTLRTATPTVKDEVPMNRGMAKTLLASIPVVVLGLGGAA